TGASAAPPAGSASAQVVSAPSSVPLNTWVHVAGIFDSGAQALRLYVNGVLQQDYISGVPQVINGNPLMQVVVPFSTVFDSTQRLLIGAGDAGSLATGREFTKGLIDEPAIYNRPLAASEIQAIFAASSVGKFSNDLANRSNGVLIQNTAKNNRIGASGDNIADA